MDKVKQGNWRGADSVSTEEIRIRVHPGAYLPNFFNDLRRSGVDLRRVVIGIKGEAFRQVLQRHAAPRPPSADKKSELCRGSIS
eukprot:4891503-Pleurochrysis_carterae.AAC.1